MTPTTMIATSLVIALTLGCGGTRTPAATEPSSSTAPPPPASYAFEVGPIPLHGERLQPHALSTLEWPRVAPNRSLAAQQRRFDSARNDAKEKEGQDLATLLWYSEPGNSDAAKPAREKARLVLRELTRRGSASEATLEMLTVSERAVGDDAAAITVYDQLILRFPTSSRHWRYRAVRAWLELRHGTLDRAKEILTGADLGAAATPSAVQYVTAWIRFRSGDLVGAHAQSVIASQTWSDLASWDALRNEVYLLGAFAGAKPEYMLQVLDDLIKGPPRREQGTLKVRTKTVVKGGKRTDVTEESVISYSRSWEIVSLGEAYLRAGRTGDAETIISKALGDKPFTSGRAELVLANIADLTGRPLDAAAHLEAAATHVAGADVSNSAGDTASMKQELASRTLALARGYRAFFAVTGVRSYADAAGKLFALYATLPARADAADVATEAARLGDVREVATPSDYRAAVVDGWTGRTALLDACVERTVQADPTAGGAVIVAAHSSADGQLTLDSLQPEAGEQGLAAIAACVRDRVLAWRMPWPTPTGRVSLTVKFDAALR